MFTFLITYETVDFSDVEQICIEDARGVYHALECFLRYTNLDLTHLISFERMDCDRIIAEDFGISSLSDD